MKYKHSSYSCSCNNASSFRDNNPCCSREKNTFRTKKQADRFIERYGDTIFLKKGVRPVRSYFNPKNNMWEVTSHYDNAFKNYEDAIKRNHVDLNLPRNFNDRQWNDAIFKHLLYDIDLIAIKIADLILSGEFDEVRTLSDKIAEYLSAFSRCLDDSAHQDCILDFQIFIFCIDREKPDLKRLNIFRNYFLKKKALFEKANSNKDDAPKCDKEVSLKNFKRFFAIIDDVKKAYHSGCTCRAQSLYAEAKGIYDQESDKGLFPYKLKQASKDLDNCSLNLFGSLSA